MNKFFLTFTLFTCILFSATPKNVYADEVPIDLNATSAVLMESQSKTVIYEKNAHEKLYPASMTKMMGLYLLLEHVENQQCSLEDEVIVSSYAASMGGTQIFLEENEKMKLEDLFKAVAINSANDAIVAIGEHLYGSNQAFVDAMNNKARDFGMKETHFMNATGFDNDNHYTSAYDMALLGCHLVSFENKILKYTSMKEGYVREDSDTPFWLVNTNKLLGHYDGLDGLKTGFTQKAGYNLTATAKRNGVRLVSTVMHLDTIAHRSQDTIHLMDYGFSQLKAISLFNKDSVVTTFEITQSLNKYLEAITEKEIIVILKKNENVEDLEIKAVLDKLDLPYTPHEEIGHVDIITPSKMKYTFPLYAKNEVLKSSFWTYLMHYFQLLFC